MQQHFQAIVAFNLCPSQCPMDTGSGDFLPQSLGSEMGQSQEAAECGLEGKSVEFLLSRSSVFCLPWAKKLLSAPACLVLQQVPGLPREHQENCGLVGAPPCGYCSNDCHMCLEGLGRKAPAGLQGSCPGGLPAAVSWFSYQCRSWTPCSCCPRTHPLKTLSLLQTSPSQGVNPCFL